MTAKLMRWFVTPVVVPLVIFGIAAAIIIAIGQTLLNVHVVGKPELERWDLWIALALALLILAGAAFVASRPRREDSLLDRELVLGSRPFFAPDLPPIDVAARNGPLGTIDDIGPGFMLYARSGALARVVGVIPGGEEFGRRYRSYLYAQGVHGASDELWIPAEAVMAVYPQTQSAFLAIKGDETETYGWNRAPEQFRRTPRSVAAL